jgi:mRNA interferase RelE/StbE
MSRYTTFITPTAWDEIKELPGNMRQRVRRAIEDLAAQPEPSNSKRLNLPQINANVYRLRMDRWRVVYTVDESASAIDIIAVRKRPPYDYGDLASLLPDR